MSIENWSAWEKLLWYSSNALIESTFIKNTLLLNDNTDDGATIHVPTQIHTHTAKNVCYGFSPFPSTSPPKLINASHIFWELLWIYVSCVCIVHMNAWMKYKCMSMRYILHKNIAINENSHKMMKNFVFHNSRKITSKCIYLQINNGNMHHDYFR